MKFSRPVRSAALALGLGTAAALIGAAVASPAQAEGAIRSSAGTVVIKDSYIVSLKGNLGAASTKETARSLASKYNGALGFTYTAALRGFSVKMSEANAKRLAANSAVASVETDGVVTATADQLNPPSWGLDRIDQESLPLNQKYTYPNTASNVTAYIIDTGIRTTHQDFGGRATWGTNTSGDGNNSDCNGHGTHVAGTVAGTAHGVAKAAKLVAVKVLNCQGSGSFAGVAAGVDWVTQNAAKPAVANMSLGGSGSNAQVETAVKNSINAGVTYALAAGNSNADACNFTPARTPEAITVGATTNTDARSSFSNFGTCLDIFAPGSAIVSAYNTSDTATSSLSGTSMASPHVAGAAALLASATPSATPQAIRDAMVNGASKNKVTSPGTGSPNNLLRVGTGDPGPGPGLCTVKNDTDVAIPDLSTVESPVTVSGCAGNGNASSKVEVHIKHTYRGDLIVSLVAPDGSAYVLHNRAGGSADNIDQTYTVNLSSEARNGTWKLRVQDAARIDVGTIDTWTLSL